MRRVLPRLRAADEQVQWTCESAERRSGARLARREAGVRSGSPKANEMVKSTISSDERQLVERRSKLVATCTHKRAAEAEIPVAVTPKIQGFAYFQL